ncbi:hypothetical protein [Tsukamurella paurometabola]|uniref:DUF5642 domain-containing protein n=2 Tax=Tsukamurella paurometabola TaxID=2061 RepID=A0A3P8JYM2_TSUPA|nr:hypothetical protein [Tsukamurella paurometabola]UEA85317.1 hypothetical protein LK411_11085 [Tsukamurella paurometabola]VDR37934.1 Uncharacterised protein [Tsukamurella paurometabola]
MRRSDQTRSLGILAAVAATGLLLTACGGSGGDAPAPSSAAPDVDVPSKALVQADLPAGLTLTTVPGDDAFQGAMNSVGQVQAAQITPAGCKDKNVAAQQEVVETIKFGVQQSIAKDKSALYGVTLLPGSARLEVFEAAGTGECATVKYGDALTQTAVRKDLPTGLGGNGFVFEMTRKIGEQSAAARTAYFSKGGVVAMVTANPGADGTIDQDGFEEILRRVAGKL